MRTHLILPLFLYISLYQDGVLGHQRLISVLPSGAVGLAGGQLVPSTIPITTTASGQQILVQQQPSVVQLVRQPTTGVITAGGLTQLIGQPGVPQIVGGQQLPGFTQVLSTGAGLTTAGLTQPLIVSSNGVGLSNAAVSTVPYPYSVGGLNTAYLNGAQVIVTSPAEAAFAGIQGSNLQTIPVQSQFVDQPLVNVNPFVRQVNEEDVAASVPIDPLDVALFDMENKGQMHMEKYAWGRSTPIFIDNPKLNEPTLPKDPRAADVPVFYSTLPTPTNAILSQPSNRVRPSPNPFLDMTGKRKKHFELYQYFRNLGYPPVVVSAPPTNGTVLTEESTE